MSNLVEKLTAAGTGEPATFLNDLVAQLWPNINAAGSQMAKDIVEPMFKAMLPGPLSSLHFTKIDLGPVPLRLSNVLTTKTETGRIQLAMNVDWAGKCDIELDGNMIPTLGVESVQLHGRLAIWLGPLTNVIPLIGAAQIAFVNPPVLNLDFTGAANVADFFVIDSVVRNVILGVINSMFTLPNRFLVKLDANNDYFKTHLYPLGIIRVIIDKAYGFSDESKGKTGRLFEKLTRAAPDCYVKVDVGAEEFWKTKTINNTHNPIWNETHDFVVTDFDQCVKLDVEDQDVNEDDEIGLGVTTVREILLAGGEQELTLVRKGEETKGKISISAQFFKFEADGGSFSATEHKGDGRLAGLATILVAGAYGIRGQREALQPSVVVTWGQNHRFQTAIQTDAPGIDIHNPAFDQNFRIPLTADLAGSGESFRVALFDKKQEVGGVDVPFGSVEKAPGMILQDKFDVGGGTTVRASIRLSGVKLASIEETKALPQRPKQG